jgi:DNA-binding beta-propeller fold protein YncE
MRPATSTRILALLLAAGGCDDNDKDLNAACRGLASGEACTWLGTKGEEGFNDDGLHRLETIVAQPQDLLFLPDGTAWFTDFNNFLVRRILPDDTVETMVGSLDPVFPGDGPLDGIPPGGANGLDWLLNHPTNLLLQADGMVMIVAWHNHKILTVDPSSGHVSVACGSGAGFAGDGGPAAMGAKFKQLNDATYDDAGNLYILDQQNERIRRIDGAGALETFAGAGTLGYSGDGGPAIDAEFSWAVGSNPNPSGGIVHHAGKLYVSDTEADLIRVIDLQTGMIDRFAGTGEEGDSGDGGPALEARLNAPRDLEIGPDGHLYFAETDNGKVKAIDLATGVIRTVVGTGELGLDDEEGLPATQTRLRRPFGVAFDPEGNLYVMDSLNSRIVKVAK